MLKNNLYNKMIKKVVKSLLNVFGFDVVRKSSLENLKNYYSQQYSSDIEFLKKISKDTVYDAIQNLADSKSQLRQDLFVLAYLNFKRNGYFVEFGATNGVKFSNSYLLEKKFGWVGILAEPGRSWHDSLQMNRSCYIELNCVWSSSGDTLEFNEVEDANLSTIDNFSSADYHSEARTRGNKYYVKTISLNDLLKKYSAPCIIDYLSIDTEGSELEILSSFDFDEYEFKVITCEHNYTANREKIYDLLCSKGYKRIFEDISRFDDWYIKLK